MSCLASPAPNERRRERLCTQTLLRFIIRKVPFILHILRIHRHSPHHLNNNIRLYLLGTSLCLIHIQAKDVPETIITYVALNGHSSSVLTEFEYLLFILILLEQSLRTPKTITAIQRQMRMKSIFD